MLALWLKGRTSAEWLVVLWRSIFVFVELCYGLEHGVTPNQPLRSYAGKPQSHELHYLDDMKNVAGFGDGQHRGPSWYDATSTDSDESDSDFGSNISEESDIRSVPSESSKSESSEASSVETKEAKLKAQVYRTCTACPHDMMKKHTNLGIHWICGGYQRARRSFKSECMMRYRNCQDGTIDASVALIANASIADVNNKLVDTRRARKSKRERSTSSSSGERNDDSEKDNKESLELTDSVSSSEEANKKYTPNSIFKGWRAWHRVCTPCPEDMEKKWRDPSIEWICGGYQRARRSFKSLCMMYYRNCQDGTMFVKIHDHRCNNDTRHGDHFFYDYEVNLSVDSDSESISSPSEDSSSSSSSSDD